MVAPTVGRLAVTDIGLIGAADGNSAAAGNGASAQSRACRDVGDCTYSTIHPLLLRGIVHQRFAVLRRRYIHVHQLGQRICTTTATTTAAQSKRTQILVSPETYCGFDVVNGSTDVIRGYCCIAVAGLKQSVEVFYRNIVRIYPCLGSNAGKHRRVEAAAADISAAATLKHSLYRVSTQVHTL